MLDLGISPRTTFHAAVWFVVYGLHVRAGRDPRGAIGGRKDAEIDFSGAASNIAPTSHANANWKESDISKVASDDGLSFDI